MEVLQAQIIDFIDSSKLQTSVPEYLWFIIALLGIATIVYILHRLVNYLISAVDELKLSNASNSEEIAVIQATLERVNQILQRHDDDIRELRNKKRPNG